MRFDRALLVASAPAALIAALGVATEHGALDLAPQVLAVAAGAIVAVPVLVLATSATPSRASAPATEDDWARAEARRRIRAEALLRHVDGSRAEWDSRVRPMLAREFRSALGDRARTDSAAADLGHEILGLELWRWVDPAAATVTARDDEGPGRELFIRILDRLERL
ncbi:hypothetical protein [Nocardia bovistercoris]|uniref:Uncharacterized protein n=1 Tax=Nocardia bovistercoris TaxID=2785916 RepID=A0A931IHA9_9NOCA|nr:hypothetical protein [Nocardia bovistercoris]MBH0781569.1 hypothetical protein [Nocardia bovistercoris]